MTKTQTLADFALQCAVDQYFSDYEGTAMELYHRLQTLTEQAPYDCWFSQQINGTAWELVENHCAKALLELIENEASFLEHEFAPKAAQLLSPALEKAIKTLKSIADTPLYGETITDETLRNDLIESCEYDEDGFAPSCDTESTHLTFAVEIARKTLKEIAVKL